MVREPLFKRVLVLAVAHSRRVLMIAYHFPPLAGSSGIQRTLRFVQHLPAFGWQPLVLTAHTRAYERTSDDLNADVPSGTVVRRAFALNAARHLSLGGRYIGATARPDRWVSWRFDAVRQGMQLVKEMRPDAIWSTYPIATAHLIGAALQKKTGLPWIADFRDPMAQDGYPADPATHAQFVAIESDAMAHAACNTFTTPGAARAYAERYPAARERIVVIENGYDEESFVAAEQAHMPLAPLHPGTLTLLHSGIVYPLERDPTQLFMALRQLRDQGRISPHTLRLRFRAAVHDALLHQLATQADVQDFIEILPPVPYRQALHEMRCADALLVLQAGNCNDQIPGKLYEYLRAQRPIFCATDLRGDTAGLLRGAGIDSIADIADAPSLARSLAVFLTGLQGGAAALADPAMVASASRSARAHQLAQQLTRVTG